MTSIVFYAKSPWEPSFRREHFLARQAITAGLDCTFIEAPADVRAIRQLGAAEFARRLPGTVAPAGRPGLKVIRRTTPVPGHRSAAAAAVDVVGLRLTAARSASLQAHAVCQLPWQWKATKRGGSGRRVFDCTDDWTALLPAARRRSVEAACRAVADEADEIIVVAPRLAELFPGRTVRTIANGVAADSIVEHPTSKPGTSRMLYLGTLSERFDAPLMAQVLDGLPGWHLDLVGPCHYAGLGDRPAPELRELVSRHSSRCRLLGPVPRSGADVLIDAADVCVIPNRAEQSAGQSSMKLYDFLGRARPVVMTPGVAPTDNPPATYEAATADAWIEAVLAAAHEPENAATERLAWARGQTWDARWPAWLEAVTGQPGSMKEST